MGIHAIHHVTAVTAQIERNLEFYTGTLGLRLVKRSVNQDDVSAYHLFYADAVGSPGTDMTFFDWPNIGANAPGLASIALTAFRVPGESLSWWEARLREAGAHPERGRDTLGRDRILFSDPEGQRLELADDTGLAGHAVPWTKTVPAESAVRGILGVDLQSARPNVTRSVLIEILGFRPVDNGLTFETGDENSYGRVRLMPSESRHVARVGAGGVHHVAFRVENDDELYAMQRKIEGAGLQTSGFVDRYYFHSLYFREPGGILFELATDGPGFATDESADALGERLALPPFLEPRRASIEAGLKPLPA